MKTFLFIILKPSSQAYQPFYYNPPAGYKTNELLLSLKLWIVDFFVYIAGLKKLVAEGVIDKGETITCVVTGHLLKDPNTAIDACTQPTEVDADIDTLRKILMNK